MIAIYNKELKALLINITGWLFWAVCSAMYGVFFVVYQLQYGLSNISSALTFMPYIFLVLIPILSMRMFAKEKKDRTDRLIMTSPVSVFSIVMGKFLALATIILIEAAFMFATVVFMSAFGTVTYLINLNALLGFVLFGLTAISVALFVSSFSSNQAVSFIVSFAILLVGMLLSTYVEGLFTSGSTLREVVSVINLSTPATNFLSGVFDLSSLLYYLLIIVFFLFLTCMVLYKGKRVIPVIAATACLIITNVLISYLPSQTQVDLSNMGIYSISDDTVAYLNGIEDDITIYVYNTKEATDIVIIRCLDRFKDASKKVTLEYVDPQSNPAFGTVMNVSNLSVGDVIVATEKRNKLISYQNLYATEVNYSTYTQTIVGFDGEGQILSAIDYVLSDNVPVIYTVLNHGELALGSSFNAVIEKLNIENRNLDLSKENSIPNDCEGLIINSPSIDMTKAEVDTIMSYLKQGGKVLFTADFEKLLEEDNYKNLLASCGYTPVEGVVCEFNEERYYQTNLYIFPISENDSLMESQDIQISTFSPYSIGFSTVIEDELKDKSPADDFTTKYLLTSSEDSVSKISVIDSESGTVKETIEKEDTDIEGPFALGGYSSFDKGGRAYVFGSPYLFQDSTNEISVGGNEALFSNVVVDMIPSAQDKEGVYVPAKYYDTPTLSINQSMLSIYAFVFVVFIPLALLLTGIIIYILRRKK